MNVSDFMGLLRRRWLALLVCVLSGVLAAAYVVHQTPPTYRATSTLIITLPATQNVTESLQGVQLTTQLLASYAAVATSRTSAERVKRRLNLPESADVIRSKISATPEPETLIVAISATDAEPDRARRIADAAAAVLIDAVHSLEQDKTDRVEASVIDPAITDAAPISPKKKLDLIVGAFLGLVVGLSLALVLEGLDRSVTTPAQAEELLRAPLLGLVPRLKATTVEPSTTLDQPLSPAGEAYRALRTAIRFVDLDRPIRTILVTSASAAEGKTTTASNLAVTLAQSGERVVLLDADLRRGRLGHVMGLPDGAGLTSVLTRRAPLADCLMGWRGVLTVLASGPLPPNPSEMLGSQVMAGVLQELAELADIVVIDGAPVLPVTDSVVLATQVDAVLLVARSGETQRNAAAEARRRLDGVGANVVGCLLNAVTARSSAGYYADYQYIERRNSSEQPRGFPHLVGRFRSSSES